MTARRRLSVRLVVITGVSAVTAGVTVTVRVITASGGALLPGAGTGAGRRAALGGTEQLLAEGEDGDEAGDLVHLHPVAGVPVTEGRVEDLEIRNINITVTGIISPIFITFSSS